MPVSANSKLDCVVRVITPENIEFEYWIAGPFLRLPAFVLDLFFRWAIFLALIMILYTATTFLRLFGAQWFVTVGVMLLYFVISWFYGIFMETVFNGRTLGKMLFRLRVISIDGRPINASQAAIRNLLRSADMAPLLSLQAFGSDAPPMYVVPTLFLGLVCMAVTVRMQRIGDIAARTMVVFHRRDSAPIVFQPDDARAYALAELIPPTFQVSRTLCGVIALYMETRKRFSPSRRTDLAGQLSRTLIQQMGLSPQTSPDLLLCALYVRTFLSEEHRAQSIKLRPRVNSAPPQLISSYGQRPVAVVKPVPLPPQAIPVEAPVVLSSSADTSASGGN